MRRMVSTPVRVSGEVPFQYIEWWEKGGHKEEHTKTQTQI